MATFGFDDHFAMFDVTPVDNQFIQEYLPQASGDYIKIYLYGLMFCYHPEEEVSLERMSHDLNLPTEEIEKAFRYWERQGTVRRVSDRPPTWKYVNLKRKNLVTEEPVDPDFSAFGEALYDAFDHGRRLHGAEIQQCYEWVEELKLPQEVVIMLLKHMARVKGQNFTIQSAGKVAVQMAQEQVRTIEEAEDFLSRDRLLYDGVRRVLRRLGKKGSPSEGQVALYRKWIIDWQFTPEAIDRACDETAKGDPSMGYLDGILRSMREEAAEGGSIREQEVDASLARGERLRNLIRTLGKGSITSDSLALYQGLEAMYPQDVILIGAQECAQNQKSLADLKKLLQSWKKRGLESSAQVEAYVAVFHHQNDLLRQLREQWNANEPRIGESSRRLVDKWENEWAFTGNQILFAARFANEARAPMSYLDKLLEIFHERGARTEDAMETERRRFLEEGRRSSSGNPERTVGAQQYPQRPYEEHTETPEEVFARLMGGEGHA